MLLYDFGMIRLVLLKQNILSHNFSEGQLLRIYLTVYESMGEFEKNKLLQLAMDGPNVNWNVLDLLDANWCLRISQKP